jgi:hypothetical protein
MRHEEERYYFSNVMKWDIDGTQKIKSCVRKNCPSIFLALTLGCKN